MKEHIGHLCVWVKQSAQDKAGINRNRVVAWPEHLEVSLQGKPVVYQLEGVVYGEEYQELVAEVQVGSRWKTWMNGQPHVDRSGKLALEYIDSWVLYMQYCCID